MTLVPKHVVPVLLLIAACRPADQSGSVQASPTARATLAGAPTGDSSAVAFVRAFYAAYAPRGRASGLAALDSLLAERPSAFAPPLLAALRRDAAARLAANGEIDGLDFEPLLNAQDACAQYDVGTAPGAIRRAGEHVLVSIYAVCGGARQALPVVVAEVAPSAGAWVFANFRYGPPADNLLTLLQQLHPGTHS